MNRSIKRREFISQSGGVLTALSAATAPDVIAQEQNQPLNVMFVICDQMRGDAMSCLGHPNANTPNIDRLSREGVLFENAYCNSPVCAPSRVSMFSGLYPHQTGRLSNLPWNAPYLKFENTIASHFADRGYNLGWIGKNHTYESEALNQFDTKSIRAREKFRSYSRYVPPHWHSDTFLPQEMCNPRKNTDEAIAYLEERARQNKTADKQPFFLHVSYFDPHPPYMAPANFTAKYCSADMQLPNFFPPAKISQRLDDFWRGFRMDKVTDEDLTETLRYYHASVEWGVDYQLGRLMNALNENGLRENTLVIFTSDHGDFMGHHRLVRKGMFFYDSLLHVPMIWSAPKHLPQHTRRKDLVQLLDIFPTLADMTGGGIPDYCEGASLKPALQGESLTRDTLYTSGGYGDIDPEVNHPGIDLTDEDDTPIHTRIMRQCMDPQHRFKMIRNKDWKLIINEAHEPELFSTKGVNIDRENVIANVPASTIRPLEQQLNSWWDW